MTDRSISRLDSWSTNRHFALLAVEAEHDLAQRFADSPEQLWYAIRVVGDYREHLKSELILSECALNKLIQSVDRLADKSF